MTVDGLVQEITPTARGIYSPVIAAFITIKLSTVSATVPDAVKKELLQHIRDYLDQK